MKNFLLILTGILVLSPYSLFAQETTPARDTIIKLEKLARWDYDSVGATRGQVFNDIWGWEGPDNREYVIMGGLDSTYFFDITSPRSPKLIDAEAGRSRHVIHRDYATYEHYCYGVVDEGRGSLQIFDLQYLPDSVHKVYDNNEFSVNAHNVFQEGGRLYLAANKLDTFSTPMTVLSLAEPNNPRLLDHFNPKKLEPPQNFGSFHDVFVRDNIVYGSAEYSGFFIIDYNDPSNPRLISRITQYPFKGYNHSSWTTKGGDILVFADETHGTPLKIFDIHDITDPTYLTHFGKNFRKGSIPHNPLIKNELVYISYYHEGVQVYDISNPNKPEYVGGYDTYPRNKDGQYSGYQGCWGVYPHFSSGTIAASDMSNGLYLFKLDTFVIKNNKEFEVEIGQNPFRDDIAFSLKNYQEQPIHYSLFGLKGRMIQEAGATLSVGRHDLSMGGLSYLPEGMYFLKVSSNNYYRIFKMIKGQ